VFPRLTQNDPDLELFVAFLETLRKFLIRLFPFCDIFFQVSHGGMLTYVKRYHYENYTQDVWQGVPLGESHAPLSGGDIVGINPDRELFG
jgi:hypothetical protein